ncbi:hypothetical protein Hanom_Chr12g01091591 [Helianthus anomalus]
MHRRTLLLRRFSTTRRIDLAHRSSTGGSHHRHTTTAYLPVLQSGQWRRHYIAQIRPKVHNQQMCLM